MLACAALLLVGLGACGRENDPPSSENDGVYEQAGNITYQLQISRQLNPYTTEDSQYVKGVLPPAQGTLAPDQLWYGVFMWAKNQTKKPVVANQRFDIIDTTGRVYHPLTLSRNLNPFRWTFGQTLLPGATLPTPGTTAFWGPTQGNLLLFKLNNDVYNNRPLTLQIRGPSGTLETTIELDL